MSELSDVEFAVYTSVRRARQCLARTEGVKLKCNGDYLFVEPGIKAQVDGYYSY